MPELNIRPRSLMGGLISSDAQSHNVDNIKTIPLDKLDHFYDHPFNLYPEAELMELAESIKEQGLIHSIIVRPKQNGRYEILSGHNRADATKLAGLDEIKAEVRDVDDDRAMLIVTEANLRQRPTLLPSEKARAYAKMHDALTNQGKTDEENALCPMGTEVKSGQAVDDIVSEFKENRRNVYRYLQLNHLIPELMERLDDKQFSFRAAVELSYLSEDEQIMLYEILDQSSGKDLSIENAEKLKAHVGELNPIYIKNILAGKFMDDASADDQLSEQIKVKAPNHYKQVSSTLTKFLKAKTKQGSEIDFLEIERVVMSAIKAYLGEEEG